MEGLGFIFGLILLVSIATITMKIAQEKGRSSTLWFILGIFFGFLALIVIAFLPHI
ncbi:MAG: hypothetical protein QNJ36_02570 [Calothrix sp. MO_167.B42]|nr:hypothetical protein [Calothrix sp. MO_167.B42]